MMDFNRAPVVPVLYFVEDYEAEEYRFWIAGPSGVGPVLTVGPEEMTARNEAAQSLNIEVRRASEVPAS